MESVVFSIVLTSGSRVRWVVELLPRGIKISLTLGVFSMAFPVVEFSREGYKIRKVFG